MIIVICTRWHKDDLVGRLEEQETKYLQGEEADFTDEWEYITFPAIATEDEHYEVFGKTFKRKKGEALWPAKFPIGKLRTIENTLGPYEFCTPAETPILMADWTSKPISEVKAGDSVVGFERGNPVKRAFLKPAKVISTSSLIAPVQRMKMESGRIVRCTAQHRWYTGRKGYGRKEYMPAVVGRRIMFVEEPNDQSPSPDKVALWHYLAGIIDGEGHIGKSAIFITQAIPRNKAVADKIRTTLTALGISFNELHSERKNPKWSEKLDFVLRDADTICRKLLRYTDIAKKDQIISRMYANGHMFIREEDKVISIEEDTREPVFSLETETGNYIAWGYASSNSALYQQKPIPSERQEFKQKWFKAWDPDELKDLKLEYFTSCDPNNSDEEVESNDEWVVTTIGKQRGKPDIYRIEESTGRGGPQGLISAIFRHVETYRPKSFSIESHNVKALMFAIREEQRERERYFAITELKNNKSVPKEVRIRGLIPLYAAKSIWHMPEDRVYEQQLLDFPKGKHDDRPDAMANFLEVLETIGHTDFDDDGTGEDYSARHKTVLDPYKQRGGIL